MFQHFFQLNYIVCLLLINSAKKIEYFLLKSKVLHVDICFPGNIVQIVHLKNVLKHFTLDLSLYIFISYKITMEICKSQTPTDMPQNLYKTQVSFVFVTQQKFTNKFLCTQRNIFEILLNRPKIRLYLPFSDRLGTANGGPFGSKLIGKW